MTDKVKENTIINVDSEKFKTIFSNHTGCDFIKDLTPEERCLFVTAYTACENDFEYMSKNYDKKCEENMALKLKIQDLCDFIRCNIIGNSQRFINSINDGDSK